MENVNVKKKNKENYLPKKCLTEYKVCKGQQGCKTTKTLINCWWKYKWYSHFEDAL